MRIYLDCGVRNAAISERLRAFGAEIADHLFDAVDILIVDARAGGAAFAVGASKETFLLLFNAIGTDISTADSIGIPENLSDDEITDLYLLLSAPPFTEAAPFHDQIMDAAEKHHGACLLRVMVPVGQFATTTVHDVAAIVRPLWRGDFVFQPSVGRSIGGTFLLTPGYKSSTFKLAGDLMHQLQMEVGRQPAVGFSALLPDPGNPPDKQLSRLTRESRLGLLLSYLSGRYGKAGKPFFCENNAFS